jgi:hypothetical protein
MTNDERYYYLLHLLKERGYTLDALAIAMKQRNLKGFSKSNLSKGAPKFNENKQEWEKGQIPAPRLNKMIEKLDLFLKDKFAISFDTNSLYYKDPQDNAIPRPEMNFSFGAPQHLGGVVRVYSSMPEDTIRAKMQQAKEIRMIQTFMSSIDAFADVFRACLTHKGKIRLLLIDPYCQAAILRQKGIPEVNLSGRVQETITSLSNLAGPNRLEVRYYNELPGIELIAVDEHLFYGMYWLRKRSRHGSFTEVLDKPGNKLAQDLNEHWEALWESGYELIPGTADEEQCLNFVCHYMRQHEHRTLRLHLYPRSQRATITHAYSGDAFQGYYVLYRGQYLSVHLGTPNHPLEGGMEEKIQRIANFIIYKGPKSIESHELMLATCNVAAINDSMFGNVMLLERVKPGASADPSKTQLVLEFLRNSEITVDRFDAFTRNTIENYLRTKNPEWERKKLLEKGLQGCYACYYTFTNRQGQKVVARRKVEIRENREVIKYSRSKIKHHFHLEALDGANIAISMAQPGGRGTSYFMGHLPDTTLMDVIVGEFFGLSYRDSIKRSWLFMERWQENTPLDAQDFSPQDPFIQVLCDKHPELKRMMSNEL